MLQTNNPNLSIYNLGLQLKLAITSVLLETSRTLFFLWLITAIDLWSCLYLKSQNHNSHLNSVFGMIETSIRPCKLTCHIHTD